MVEVTILHKKSPRYALIALPAYIVGNIGQKIRLLWARACIVGSTESVQMKTGKRVLILLKYSRILLYRKGVQC